MGRRPNQTGDIQSNAIFQLLGEKIAALDDAHAIAGTSNNTNGVATLGLTVSDPPTQSEMQTIANKIDELINALRK